MLSCPYQGIFKQSTKFTENVLEKLSKLFFRKMHAKLFECSKNYLFQCLTYHRQYNGQQKWFCKSYTSKIHSRGKLPNTLTQMNNSYSQLTQNVRVKDRITNLRHFVVPITLCQQQIQNRQSCATHESIVGSVTYSFPYLKGNCSNLPNNQTTFQPCSKFFQMLIDPGQKNVVEAC